MKVFLIFYGFIFTHFLLFSQDLADTIVQKESPFIIKKSIEVTDYNIEEIPIDFLTRITFGSIYHFNYEPFFFRKNNASVTNYLKSHQWLPSYLIEIQNQLTIGNNYLILAGSYSTLNENYLHGSYQNSLCKLIIYKNQFKYIGIKSAIGKKLKIFKLNTYSDIGLEINNLIEASGKYRNSQTNIITDIDKDLITKKNYSINIQTGFEKKMNTKTSLFFSLAYQHSIGKLIKEDNFQIKKNKITPSLSLIYYFF